MKKIFLFLMIFSPLTVFAHPHVWVDVSLKLDFNKNKEIGAITEIWKFDDMFSMAVIKANDKNNDNDFNEDEIISIKKTYFINLQRFGFYTHVFMYGKELPLKMQLKDFSAEIVEEKVIYMFTLIPAKQVNPFKQKIDIGIYDSEYYVEISYDEDPIFMKGIGNAKCPYYIFEDKKHPTYFGLVNPETIALCQKK